MDTTTINLEEFKKLWNEQHPYREPQFLMWKSLRAAYKELYGCDPVEGEMYCGMRIVFYDPPKTPDIVTG